MDRTYSIAEARNDLSNVVREAEAGRPVTLSRRGKVVAVVVSSAAFANLQAQRPTLSAAIAAFRQEYPCDLDDSDWLPARDPAPGRDTPWR